MDSISSINTSFYPEFIEGYIPVSTQPVDAVKTESGGQNQGGKAPTSSNVDLSSYYSDIRPEDLLSQTGRNVTQAAEALGNAMISAVQNGFGVNEAVNIKLAETAYRANAYMFKAANEISTFLLEV